MKETTCGVVVTDGAHLLLGHATRSPRWDIPKGIANPGEAFVSAAARELFEETGLVTSAETLTPLGVHRYRSGKDLALFEWRPVPLPDPTALHCASYFEVRNKLFPEFDKFALFDWDTALSRVGRDMARVLTSIHERIKTPPL
jgi:putative (di)nucleoside polyphosphate hydrolase